MRFIDREEVARRLTYEAAIPIVREAMIAFSTGQFADFAFGFAAQREQDLGQLGLGQPGEKIRLVFVRIRPAHQPGPTRRLIADDSRVVAGGETAEAEPLSAGARKQEAELHLGVAQGAGVGGEPRQMLAPEFV